MKKVLQIFTLCCFIALLASCGKSEKICKGVMQGMYEGAKQAQEMKTEDPVPEPGKEIPSYGQYERERQEIIKDKAK